MISWTGDMILKDSLGVIVGHIIYISEEPDMEYQVLPWRADKTVINQWLVQQGYDKCVAKLSGKVNGGSQLYAMDRETLKEMLGSSDGVRLYSQLQRDKPKSEKEAGILKETELQVS